MSITLGIYDVFSYAIPGILYLFTFNEGLRLLRLPSVDVSRLDNVAFLILLALLSYLVGHLLDYISHRIWYRRFYPGQSPERAHSRFEDYSGMRLDFKPRQWPLLLSAIRQNNMEVANTIDKNKATSIMLRNVSFALFLLTIVLGISALTSGFSFFFLLGTIASLIGCIVSLRRGDEFNQWFYQLIYEQSLMYGTSLDEVLENSRCKIRKDEEPTITPGKRGQDKISPKPVPDA